jgi:predicted nuclease of predicted toxin-antitoxin system
VKLLLDENVDNRLKPVLENLGFEISTTYGEGLTSVSDEKILDYALENGFVVVTHDDDLLGISDGREEFPSIVYLRQRTRFRQMKQKFSELEIDEPVGSIHPP